MIRRYAILPLLVLASVTHAQATPLDNLSAADVNGPAAVAPLAQPQPPAKLIVDPPLAGPLSKGAVFIQYRRYSDLKRSRSPRASGTFTWWWMTRRGTGLTPAESR